MTQTEVMEFAPPGTPADLGARPTGLVAVVNANSSGVRRVPALLDELRRGARAADVPLSEVVTAGHEELRRVLRDAGTRRVVLIGGDGSVQASVNATPSPPELALLSAGRANNIARALGIPTEPSGAVAVALRARCRPLDVLCVEGRRGTLRCVEGVSAGFQARARATYGGVNSGDLGAGVRAFARALRDHRPAHVELEVDGRPAFAGDVAQVFLSSMPFFGFGFRVDPLADPSDGMLEAIVLPARSRRELARLLIAAYRGTHVRRPGVLVIRGRRATLHSDLALAGDGTPFDAGDVIVSIEPAAVRIAAPGPW